MIIYTSPGGDGRVLQTYLKEPEEHGANFAAAKILADKKGYQVEFLGVSDIRGEKSADALINGIPWEIKTNKTPEYDSISDGLRDAGKQSPNVILHVLSDIFEIDWRRAVYHRTRYRHPRSHTYNLRNITVITKMKGSSEKFVGGFGNRKVSKCMV